MEFRTKREAERAAYNAEQGALRHRELAAGCRDNEAGRSQAAKLRDWARERDAEAARIRALLPTLPD